MSDCFDKEPFSDKEQSVALYELVLRADQGYFAAVVFRRVCERPYSGGKCFSGIHT